MTTPVVEETAHSHSHGEVEVFIPSWVFTVAGVACAAVAVWLAVDMWQQKKLSDSLARLMEQENALRKQVPLEVKEPEKPADENQSQVL